jgi:hypothetical protein
MSHSTVYGLWPGTEQRVQLAEFPNAWGMTPVVWGAVAQRHLGAPPHGWMQHMDAMWPLADRADIPLATRAVLRMTFDTRYILAADVKRAVDDIAIFLYAYRDVIDSAGVNHWPLYAIVLVTQWREKPQAFGVHHTSVSENPWEGPYDEDTDRRLPFDWATAASVY